MRLTDLVSLINERRVFVFDLETTTLRWFDDDASIEGMALYIPRSKDRTFEPKRVWLPFVPGTIGSTKKYLDLENTLEVIRPVFENPDHVVIAQNIRFDQLFLHKFGVDIKARKACTKILANMVLNRRKNDLQGLAMDYLGVEIIPYKQAKSGQNFLYNTRQRLGDYAMDQVEATWRLFCIFHKKLKELDASSLFTDLYRLYWDVEMRVSDILFEMSAEGVVVDPRKLFDAKEAMQKRLNEIEDRLKDNYFWLPNLNSHTELARFIYSDETGCMGIKAIGNKTATGRGKTDRSTLEVLARRYEDVALILEWRSIDGIQKIVAGLWDESLREPHIHPSFSQTSHAVGRITSTEPINMTAIPSGYGVRNAFVTSLEQPADELFLSLDYDQLEMRMLGNLSEDPALVQIMLKQNCDCQDFQDDGRCIHTDVHIMMARKFGVSREKGKILNYQMIFGVGPDRLAAELDMVSSKGSLQRAKAQGLIDGWFKTFTKAHEFFIEQERIARVRGWKVVTESGRLRSLLDDKTGRFVNYSKLGRQVRHHAVSSFASDVFKMAMIKIADVRKQQAVADKRWKDVKFRNQVHDQLIFSAPRDFCEVAAPVLKDAAEFPSGGEDEFLIPLTCTVKVGSSFGELEDA